MDDALRLLRASGYDPRVIVDGGANVGTWTDLATRRFTAREHHLVEPQPACHPALARFQPPRFTVHPVALTGAGIDAVVMVGGGGHGGTGAFVSKEAGHGDATRYPATSLDGLLGGRITRADRALLKLDVEGHELEILRASSVVLPAIEVAILEFQAFEIEGNGRPVFIDVVTLMRDRGFSFYDIAALASRPRDRRLRMGDAIFVRDDSPLVADARWA